MAAAFDPRRRRAMQWLLGGAVGFGAWAAEAEPTLAAAEGPAVLRFGVLPFGGAVESREQWLPLLSDLSRTLGRPVAPVSVASYESLEQVIRRREVDMAFLSAKLALDAAVAGGMNVIAEVSRSPGALEHRALLLTRKAGPLQTLEELLARPEAWRIARGDGRSVSGFILPQLQLFLPRRIALETRFQSELVGTHQANALAVANGDADVATGNTTDFARFHRQFPAEAERLQVVWRSSPVPPGYLMVRRDLPPSFQARLQGFLTAYGKGAGNRGALERGVLKLLQTEDGYAAAGNATLVPAAQLDRDFEMARARAAHWVSDAALQQRLQRIEQTYAAQVNLLSGGRR